MLLKKATSILRRILFYEFNLQEEIQLVRRQIAKLNHRLMAVELENQQQQQREM